MLYAPPLIEEKDPPANLYRTWVLTPMIEPFPDAAAGPEVSPPSVGSQAPEIEGQDVDGETFRLSDYRGKVVLLDFWGHW